MTLRCWGVNTRKHMKGVRTSSHRQSLVSLGPLSIQIPRPGAPICPSQSDRMKLLAVGCG